MQPHQERVLREKEELDLRLGKLLSFNESGHFVGLSLVEQKQFRRQALIMELYSEVLADRIAAFE